MGEVHKGREGGGGWALGSREHEIGDLETLGRGGGVWENEDILLWER